MAKRKSKMAKILINCGAKKISVSISDDIAQYLSGDEGGTLTIERFLGKKYLKNIGYHSLSSGQMKCLSICSSTGMYLFSSVA